MAGHAPGPRQTAVAWRAGSVRPLLRITQNVLAAVGKVAKVAGVITALVYAYNFVFVYRKLRQRQAFIASFKGRPASQPHLRHQQVSREEYDQLVAELVAKVPEPRLGILSLASPATHRALSHVCGFLSGPSAALLQLAHPFVAHGILHHSSVQQDVRMRFHRTFFYVFRITFGDLDTALQASRAVRSIHSRIHGAIENGTLSFPKGSQYTAHDKDALLWVLATLFEGALFINELFLGEFTKAERDELVRFMAVNAPMYGIDPRDVPQDYESFMEYYMGMIHSDVLQVTDEGRALARYLTMPILWEKHAGSADTVNTLRSSAAVLMPEPIATKFHFSVGTTQYLSTAAVLALLRMVHAVTPLEGRQYTPYLKTRAAFEGKPLGLLPRVTAAMATAFVEASLGGKPPAKAT